MSLTKIEKVIVWLTTREIDLLYHPGEVIMVFHKFVIIEVLADQGILIEHRQ